MKTLLVLTLAVGAALADSKPPLHARWAEFKSSHGKEYHSPLEEMRRMAIFTSNWFKIEEHNANYEKGDVTYYKGMNHFGDLTQEEFSEYVNRGRANRPKEDPADHLLPWEPSKLPAAAYVDWRGSAVTGVKNQGSCGSCWSFSTTGAVEGQIALRGGGLVSLSEQNLIDCSTEYGNAACNGGWMDSAFNYIHDYGIMPENSYPYEGQLDSCRFVPSQSVTTLRGYYDLPSGSEAELASAISNNGPVSVAVYATDELQFYAGGVFYDRTCNPYDLNHGVLAVGYGSEGGYDYWIVKNSWGSGWGEGGYYRAIRNFSNNCGVATAPSLPAL